MSIKAGWKAIKYHHNAQTGAGVVGISIFYALLSAVPGALLGGLSTNVRLDGAEDRALEEKAIAEYTRKFSDYAKTEEWIVRLKQTAEAAKMDTVVADDQAAAKRRYDRAVNQVQLEESGLAQGIDATSRLMMADKRIGEGKYDNLVKDFNSLVKSPLPTFLADQKKSESAAFLDSSLRECQLKYDDPHKVNACTGDETFKWVGTGAAGTATLSLLWTFIGPLRRRREFEAGEEQECNKTQTLKVTYTPEK